MREPSHRGIRRGEGPCGARPPGRGRSGSEGSASASLHGSREAARLVGVTRRQLQYWARTGLVRPSVRTRGGHHRYAFRDLVALRAAKRLIDAGVSVQRIRKSLAALRRIAPDVEQPLAELVLVAADDVVLVFREGSVIETPSGQTWAAPVATLGRAGAPTPRAPS